MHPEKRKFYKILDIAMFEAALIKPKFVYCNNLKLIKSHAGYFLYGPFDNDDIAFRKALQIDPYNSQWESGGWEQLTPNKKWYVILRVA